MTEIEERWENALGYWGAKARAYDPDFFEEYQAEHHKIDDACDEVMG